MNQQIDTGGQPALRPISEIATHGLGLPADAIETYGRHKAKLPLDLLPGRGQRGHGRLVLVTAITPTPAGEGKTTTAIGLGDGLSRLGKRAVVALRQPSLGPVFGLKGGAAGGGRAQIEPMQDINLHFTGDFNAVGLAHNLLAAMLDNHLHHGNAMQIDIDRIHWPRVLDLNDRALRNIMVGLGGRANGPARASGFDIVAASEVMAILCLADSRADLHARLERIVVADRLDHRPVTALDLQASGAMAALLRDALMPNLVQTREGTPVIVHGGPFANIAHGCNSLLATRAALRFGDYAITEAGFGADLGAEKFIDIKCRESGLRPDLAVVVATLRALKFHGGVAREDLGRPDPSALRRGMANLERHLQNLERVFGLRCLVAINRFAADSDEELELVAGMVRDLGVHCELADHWARGGEGTLALAQAVVDACETAPPELRFAYPLDEGLIDKARRLACTLYGASELVVDPRVAAKIARLEEAGHQALPVCMAKTPYSFSGDPALRGAPTGHLLHVRDVRLAAGAGFVVMICGDVMTMPGLPGQPAAHQIDLDAAGHVTGLR